jgi:hypothetical protein
MDTKRISGTCQTWRGIHILVFVILMTLGGASRVMAQAPAATPAPPQDFCWKETNGRGAGVPLDANTCDNPGWEKDPHGLLCYPRCNANYTGVGPVCWQNCPAGFSDNGAFCAKPNNSYGRGAGYVAWDQNKCNNENPQGCEENGLIWYPKCKPGFHAVGCCTCSPDCPSNMTDIGVSCQKQSYGRGAGGVLGCATGLERSGLLCYTRCPKDSDGVGPVCWEHCPANWVQCGMGCAQSTSACASETAGMVTSVLSAVAQIAADVVTAGAGGEALATAKAATATAEEAAAKAADKLTTATAAAEKTAASAAEKTAAEADVTAAKNAVDKAKADLEAATKKEDEARTAVINDPKVRTSAINDMAKRLSDGHLIDGLNNFSTKRVTAESLAESLKVRMAPSKGDVLAKTPQAVAKLANSINAIQDIANHPDMSADQKNFAIAQTVLSDASIVDPTGIVGIVSAYAQPMCNVIGPPAGQ